MADRYWVGGSGTWNSSSTTNWSTASGGASGASAPTSSDDVYFDPNSGGGTVTIAAGAVCLSLNDFVGTTFSAGASPSLSIYANWYVPVGSYTGFSTSIPVTFYAQTSKQTVAGTAHDQVGSVIYWGGSSSITLGAVAVVVPSAYSGIIFTADISFTSLTFNRTFSGLPKVCYVYLTSSIINSISSGLNFGVAVNPYDFIVFWGLGNAQTTLSVSGSVSNYLLVGWHNINTPSASIGSASNRSLLISDLGGNSGFTFATAATRYISSGSSSVDLASTVYATSSGGSTSAANQPLGQDTLVIDNNSCASGGTITNDYGVPVGIISASGRSNSVSLGGTTAPFVFCNTYTGSSSVNLTATQGVWFAAGTTTAKTLTFSGGSHTSPVYLIDGVFTLGSAFTTSGLIEVLYAGMNQATYTLTASNLTSGTFSIGYTNATPQNFSGGNLTLTGSGNLLVQTGSFFFGGGAASVYTITLTYSGSVATDLDSPFNNPEDYNLSVTAGTYTLTFDGGNGGAFATVDFTGFSGTSRIPVSIYGGLTFSTGMTVTAGAIVTFRATSGSNNITSNGKSFGTTPVVFNGVGGTWVFQDAFTTTGSFTQTNGTVNLNGKTVTASSYVTATGTKNLTFNGGTLVVTTSGTTAFNNATPTNYTTTAGTGAGSISMSSAIGKTFVGAGSTFNCAINQGGAGTLTISGTNTFNDLTNTYGPTGATTISLAANQTFVNFNGNGTSGKLLTFQSSSAGTRRTVNFTGTPRVAVDYLSVRDIGFTPAPAADGSTPYIWYLGVNSTNNGNNAGGLFQDGSGATPIQVYQITNTATTSWTVPADWNSGNNTIHMIGGGGGGATAAVSGNNRAAGGGGGGGGYTAVTNYSASAGSSITVAVGIAGTANNDGGNTTWASGAFTAGGGKRGTAATTPTSAGGAGGTGTFAGGAGGRGAFGTVASTGYGGGGGGGAAGPLGIGGTGGIGFGTITAGSIAGGGGGGNGGGSNATNGAASAGGDGGNNASGVGGATANSGVGTFGGGGGGGISTTDAGSGGSGIDVLNTIGGAGGKGGSPNATTNAANAGVYGGGGGGGGLSTGGLARVGGAGSQGIIIITYTPSGPFISATITETASGSDVVSSLGIFGRSVSETATGADSILSRVIFQGDINEVGTASDVIQAIRAYLSQILESASGLDSVSAVQGFASAFSDTVSGTDSVSAKYTAQASVSETASLADVVNGGLFFLGQISESASAADVLIASKAYFAAIADGASIVDAVAVAAATFNATAADTAVGIDSVSTRATFISSITDTATGTDTVAPRYIANPVILESGTGADTFAASQSFSTQILEAGTGADTVTVAASTFNAIAADTATGTETVTAKATFRSSTTDTATGTDTVAPSLVISPVILESGTGTDTFAAKQAFFTQIQETGTGADTVTVAPSVFNAPVVEISTIADTVAPPGSIYNAPVVETVVITEALIASFLWNLIADNQTPGWQNINNSQPTTWSLEQTDQSPGWNGIKTL